MARTAPLSLPGAWLRTMRAGAASCSTFKTPLESAPHEQDMTNIIEVRSAGMRVPITKCCGRATVVSPRRPRESGYPYSLNYRVEGDAGAIFSPSPRRSVVMGPRFRGDDIECLAMIGRRKRLRRCSVILRCEPRLRRASKDARPHVAVILRGSQGLAPQDDGCPVSASECQNQRITGIIIY